MSTPNRRTSSRLGGGIPLRFEVRLLQDNSIHESEAAHLAAAVPKQLV
jgi:hypothetical protein